MKTLDKVRLGATREETIFLDVLLRSNRMPENGQKLVEKTKRVKETKVLLRLAAAGPAVSDKEHLSGCT